MGGLGGYLTEKKKGEFVHGKKNLSLFFKEIARKQRGRGKRLKDEILQTS